MRVVIFTLGLMYFGAEYGRNPETSILMFNFLTGIPLSVFFAFDIWELMNGGEK